MNERARTDVVNLTICSALSKCTAPALKTWAVLTVYSLYTCQLAWRIGRQTQECVIVFLLSLNYGVPCKGTGTKTKQTRNKNTGLKPKQKSEEYLEQMFNTQDETCNHLRNPQWHESQNTQHRYSHTPMDIVTIINSPLETKGHTYTSTNQWEQGTGVRNESSGGIRDNQQPSILCSNCVS